MNLGVDFIDTYNLTDVGKNIEKYILEVIVGSEMFEVRN